MGRWGDRSSVPARAAKPANGEKGEDHAEIHGLDHADRLDWSGIGNTSTPPHGLAEIPNYQAAGKWKINQNQSWLYQWSCPTSNGQSNGT